MTPRTRKITLNVAALTTALLGALAWGVPSAKTVVGAVQNIETRTHADSLYARRDSLTLWRQRDSLLVRDAVRELREHGDSVARDLKGCIRHPEDCRR